jgi:hypothetical protein
MYLIAGTCTATSLPPLDQWRSVVETTEFAWVPHERYSFVLQMVFNNEGLKGSSPVFAFALVRAWDRLTNGRDHCCIVGSLGRLVSERFVSGNVGIRPCLMRDLRVDCQPYRYTPPPGATMRISFWPLGSRRWNCHWIRRRPA